MREVTSRQKNCEKGGYKKEKERRRDTLTRGEPRRCGSSFRCRLIITEDGSENANDLLCRVCSAMIFVHLCGEIGLKWFLFL